MNTSLTTELRDHLMAYLSGKSTLEEFEAWFVPATWDVQESDDPDLVRMRNTIEGRVAEYTNGDWSEDELKEFLRPFVETRIVSLAVNIPDSTPARSSNSSSTRIVQLGFNVVQVSAPMLAPNPMILASRPDSLNQEAERYTGEKLAI